MSVIGKWRNQYGSILDIQSQGPNGELGGLYTSDTGASGVYPIKGWTPPSNGLQNEPISVCVSWKPTQAADEDPSWDWVSVMSGMLFLDGPTAAPRIQVLHGLIASTPSEAVKIRRPGVYTETLIFEQLANRPQSPASNAPHIAASAHTAARLILMNHNPASMVGKVTIFVGPNGWADATIDLPDQVMASQGFVGSMSDSHLCSVALSGLVASDQVRSIGFGGLIDMPRSTAVLQLFDASAVPYKDKYVAVGIGQETFSVVVSS